MARPDFTTQDAATYKGNIDDSLAHTDLFTQDDRTGVTGARIDFITFPTGMKRAVFVAKNIRFSASNTIQLKYEVGSSGTFLLCDVVGATLISTTDDGFMLAEIESVSFGDALGFAFRHRSWTDASGLVESSGIIKGDGVNELTGIGFDAGGATTYTSGDISSTFYY